MTISKELLDELLKGCERPEDLLGHAGLIKELKIKLMERMLGAELTAHLGYEEGKEAPPAQGTARFSGVTIWRIPQSLTIGEWLLSAASTIVWQGDSLSLIKNQQDHW